VHHPIVVARPGPAGCSRGIQSSSSETQKQKKINFLNGGFVAQLGLHIQEEKSAGEKYYA
jgi:hypothetical protein